MHRYAFEPLKKATKPLKIAITGADGYSGRYMTELLLQDKNITEIRNLTQKLEKSKSNSSIPIQTNFPLNFDTDNKKTSSLEKSLEGIDTFICTYWMRYGFDAGLCPALERVKSLTDAAKNAGVKKMIYVSHTQPKINTDIGYIKAKAQAEQYISQEFSDLEFAFVRPCLLFGDSPSESIVANNTAYLLRKMPVMMFPGDIKKVHFQPVHVRDLAQMAVNLAVSEQKVQGFIDAVGPEKFTFHEFISLYPKFLNLSLPRILLSTHLPASMIYQLTKPINFLLNDLYIEKGDLKILEQNLACSESDQVEGQRYWGTRRFSDWLDENKEQIGKEYVNSFQRYYGVDGKRDVFSFN